MKYSNRLAVLITPILCVLFSACSSYTGTKLGVRPNNTKVVPDGVPFNLARPEYKLTRTLLADPDAKPEYTLAVSYEADPSQRYSLRIDPGIFANPGFTLNLAANGTITGTVTTITEQLTPAITALGSFATSVIGAVGVFDESSVRSEIEAALSERSCQTASDVAEAVGGQFSTVKDVIVDRVNAFKDDDEYTALFHFFTENERLCLNDSYERLSVDRATELQNANTAWQDAAESYKNDHAGDADYLMKLSQAVDKNDADAFKTLLNITNDPNALGFIETRKQQRAALYAVAVKTVRPKEPSRAEVSLKFLSSMDSVTWRARHVLYLEREIDRLELQRLRLSKVPPKEIAAKLAALETQRAEVIGADVLLQRKRELSRFLGKLERKVMKGGTAPATAEYVEARKELDATSTQIAVERTRVLAAAKPAPKRPLPPLTDVRVERALQRDIVASSKTGWFKSQGKDMPDYVLVLEEVQ